jgi:hypothetical protein
VKKFLYLFLLLVFSFTFLVLSSQSTSAFFDPFSRPNNFHGIHILFPSELTDAAKLVNSRSGEWGYVTIPIQAGDKDLEKWQNFMNDARRLKLIPIIRLSTEGDPFNTNVWRKPTATDILDFANFLNSLTWPIENRYVIVFNETNRYDEWGGEAPDPASFAGLLSYAYQTFKDRSPNFFTIMGGLDNAAPNDGLKYMDNFVYMKKMLDHNPDIFKKIDGFASHSYPNPGFTAPPLQNKLEGVTTYQYEYTFINSNSDRKIPAFITETGWDSSKLPESVVAKYFQITYDNFWNKDKDKIVAITPFLLHSQGGAFDIFSFVKNGRQTQYYEASEKMEKTKGEPLIQAVKGIALAKIKEFRNLSLGSSAEEKDTFTKKIILKFVRYFF